ncbi:MAG TPA: hypothetical protein VFG05_04945 [Methylocella sp.]|nr:hypothetical protein [Methylocella sp.]
MTVKLVAQSAQTRLALTETLFAAWIAQAEAGEVLEYHQGFLVLDADKASTRLNEPDRTRLLKLARCAWRAAEQRLVHLVQRRLGEGDFSYLAIARARPKSVPASLSKFLLQEAA